MKTKIYNKVRALLLLLAPCSLLLFASCEDYLKTESKSALTTDNAYTKAAGIAKTILQKMSTIENMMQDCNPEKYAHVLTTCRRLWSEIANLLFSEVFPDNSIETYKTLSGKTINVSKDHDNNRLSAVIEKLQSKAAKNTLIGSEIVYLVDWVEQINDIQNAGVHSNVTKELAERCIIHTYIALGDILSLKEEADKNTLTEEVQQSQP